VPILTVDQILTPMSTAQVRAMGVTVLTALGLQPNNWAQGGIASSVLTAACTVVASLSQQLSNGIAQQWNPTASGGGLQLLSKFFYGFSPPQPTFATGELALLNFGGGIYSYGAGQVQFSSTVANSNGVYPTYTNTDAFTLLAGAPLAPVASTPALVGIQATNVQGSGGNSNPGFVTQLVTALIGVTCNNPAAVVGADALTVPALRSLNVASIAARSAFGPRGAYQFAIQTAVNAVTGLPVNVNRWSISIASHTGDVTIYVASPAGPVTTTDLEGMSSSIELVARPDGVTVLPGLPGFPSAPASATTVPYGPTITVYCVAPVGASASALATVVENALTLWFEGPTNPIGGLVASDDVNTNTSGIFESGVAGVIAQAIATQAGCYMISAKFTGTSDLVLTPGLVATNETSVIVIPQVVS
jgi:hypothetical protein